MAIRVKRVYEAPAAEDGLRILVDRLWPRGLKKEAARLDLWLREAGPSDELRRWFGHDPGRWEEFRRRYAEELATKAELLEKIVAPAREGPVTLLYGAKDGEHNQAVALRDYLEARHS